MIRSKAFRVCAFAAAGLAVSALPAMAQCGTASWYHEGARTATGERYNPDGITAAHRSLPFGTRVKVTHKGTGRSVIVRINDRGPFIRGRIIDLSRGAKRVIGMGGLASVCLTVLGRGERFAADETAARKRSAKRRAKSNERFETVYGATQTSARREGERAERKRLARDRQEEPFPQRDPLPAPGAACACRGGDRVLLQGGWLARAGDASF
ncbi:MAG: septal ring lytic transglycosylase RlpA family protein [Rhodomicrobium sp.]|nr:septal ring lytic transglycosylase RlpA family protein [Rhodomicrobium sp.]